MIDKRQQPPGWTSANLPAIVGSDGLISDGDWVESKDQDPNGNVRLTQLADVGEGYFRDRSRRFLRTDQAERLGCTYLKVGDVLIARMPEPLGRACLYPGGSQPAVTVVDVCIVRPGAGGVSARWLVQFINAPQFRFAIAGEQRGSTRKRVSKKSLCELELPLPPSGEQRRIADEVDSYLTRLDDAVASIERIRTKLKAYHAAVLKAAVEGRLVPTEASLARAEKREYEPAELLLARIRKERLLRWEEGELAKLKRTGKAPSHGKRKAKDEESVAPDTSGLPVLPEGWCWATVNQVAEDTAIGLVRSRQQQRKGPPGYAYLKMDAIGLNGSLKMDQFVYVDADKADAERYALRANEILFNTRNSVELVGKTALVPIGANGRLFNNNIMRIRVSNGLAPAFIALQMSSLPFRARLEKIKRATTNVAAIYGKDLFPQVLAIPPAAEQERITEIVASLLSTQEAVNNTIVSQLKRIARLRQSVLMWAFDGKCVDQDPSDEPAEKLLARIRADRAVIDPRMKRRGRRVKGAA